MTNLKMVELVKLHNDVFNDYSQKVFWLCEFIVMIIS